MHSGLYVSPTAADPRGPVALAPFGPHALIHHFTAERHHVHLSIDPDSKEPWAGDRLARAREAIIDNRKLRDYALDPDHPDRGRKARLVAAILYIGRDDRRHLHAASCPESSLGQVDRIKTALREDIRHHVGDPRP